ncbi:hypothetical protein MTQ01_22120 [Streptomyces sp. XM4193]|uniref:hypothetical protein n=1 Tax=Streptomyces sp. XM4193 TaxID=2929782 RepID=UPI001FF7345E|nr:hypothetical protein [Streptomyces sp. XM4193]MCK1798671.1 hypothetical protein [Streptomyces sp. XM4193]
MQKMSWRDKFDTGASWSEVHHAYGRASDLPDLFDRAGSSDAREAARAVSEISMRICHQGMAVAAATARSVPVLVAITEYATSKGVERIIRLPCVVSESLGTWSRISRQLEGTESGQAEKADWEAACFDELKIAVEMLKNGSRVLSESSSAGATELEQSVLRAEKRINLA